nr:MAG TPA: hypothetical protein [Caudoviricetes sp.]
MASEPPPTLQMPTLLPFPFFASTQYDETLNHDGTLQMLIQVFVANGSLCFIVAVTDATEPLVANVTAP